MSNVWRGIVTTTDVLKKGIGHFPHNGRMTGFWKDLWIGSQTLISMAFGLVSEIEEETVNMYWTPNIDQNCDKIDSKLPEAVAEQLRAYHMLEEEEVIDNVYWSAESSCTFSVCSAYNLICENAWSINDREWEHIWKIKAPKKMRSFIWLAKHKRIMCNSNRKRRSFTQDDKCVNCQREIEGVDNVLRRCPKAKEVWENMFSAMTNMRWWHDGCDHQIEKNLKTKTVLEDKGYWNEAFVIIAWRIWRWQNDDIFRGETRSIKQKTAWIISQCKEVTKAFMKKLTLGGLMNEIERRWLRWEKPEQGWWKLNYDGCVKDGGRQTGYGGVVRDNNGDWKFGFSFNLGSCTIDEAEAWGILRGFKIAWDKGIRQVEVECDLLRVIKWMQALEVGNKVQGPIKNIIESCKQLLKREQRVKFNHIYREQNQVAGLLAKNALAYDRGGQVYTRPPIKIESILEDDVWGLRRTRNV